MHTAPFHQRLDTYLTHPRKDVKESFHALVGYVRQTGLLEAGGSWLDVGCATGDLIRFAASEFTDTRFVGLDIEPPLLDRARAQTPVELAPRIQWTEGDATTWHCESFDVVSCVGVIGQFDEPFDFLTQLLGNCRPGGRLYVFGLFNPDDIDVRLAYRDHTAGADWNSGFNIYSQRRISLWLQGRVAGHRFHPFTLSTDVPRIEGKPHRSYTLRLDNQQRLLTNGVCLRLVEHFLEIMV